MGGKKQEGGEARNWPWVKGCPLTLDAEKGKEVTVSLESPRGLLTPWLRHPMTDFGFLTSNWQVVKLFSCKSQSLW